MVYVAEPAMTGADSYMCSWLVGGEDFLHFDESTLTWSRSSKVQEKDNTIIEYRERGGGRDEGRL